MNSWYRKMKIFCNNTKVNGRLYLNDTEKKTGKWEQQFMSNLLPQVNPLFLCEDDQFVFLFLVICHKVYFDVCGFKNGCSFMVIKIGIWLAWSIFQFLIKITIASLAWLSCWLVLLYFVRSIGKPAVNKVFYSRFKGKFYFIFRSFSVVGLAPVSATTLTRIIESKICNLYFIYLSKKTHEFEWYRVTC